MTGNNGGSESSFCPGISIVIPAHNEGKRIARCLEALRNQSLDRGQYEVIVVDDGSEDDTVDVAARQGARVVRQPRKGAAAARNRGIDEARGEIILFTDADCIPEEHWAERLSTPLTQPDVQGAVGRINTRQDHWVACLTQVELNERYSRMGRQERIDFVGSGTCGFKRSLLCRNRFDESFGWAEDLELSFRLANGGNRMIFVPDAVVEHDHPEGLLAYMRRKFCYASYAPRIYRKYPNKVFSDSRTPSNLRWQILMVVLALASAPAAILSAGMAFFSLACLMGAVALTLPVCQRAARKSVALAFVTPLFILTGNLAFAAGTVWGIVSGAGFRTR
jgi:glycosyltransferase involved in cell wall biosynthesis